jgi:hypothetical protein
MQGSSVWTIDSGSECCVTIPDELTESESKRVFPLDRPIPLVTGNGAMSAESAMDVDPLGSRAQLRALVLPDCPPILSLGKLVMDMDFDFVWKAQPEGVPHQLELDGRVHVWPLCRARILACAGCEEAASPAPETAGA